MKRHYVLTGLAAAVAALVITARSGDAEPVVRDAEPARSEACAAPEATPMANGNVFWGCWTYWAAGPCRAIYRDAAGNFTQCGQCGPSGEPNPNQCTPISSTTLNHGYWCS